MFRARALHRGGERQDARLRVDGRFDVVPVFVRIFPVGGRLPSHHRAEPLDEDLVVLGEPLRVLLLRVVGVLGRDPQVPQTEPLGEPALERDDGASRGVSVLPGTKRGEELPDVVQGLPVRVQRDTEAGGVIVVEQALRHGSPRRWSRRPRPTSAAPMKAAAAADCFSRRLSAAISEPRFHRRAQRFPAPLRPIFGALRAAGRRRGSRVGRSERTHALYADSCRATLRAFRTGSERSPSSSTAMAEHLASIYGTERIASTAPSTSRSARVAMARGAVVCTCAPRCRRRS